MSLRLIFNAQDPYEGCYVPRGRQPMIIPWYYVLARLLHFIGHVNFVVAKLCAVTWGLLLLTFHPLKTPPGPRFKDLTTDSALTSAVSPTS